MPKAIITRAASPKAAAKAKATKPAKLITKPGKPVAKKPAVTGEAKATASATRSAAYTAFKADVSQYAGASLNFNRSRSTTPIHARDIASYTQRLDAQTRELAKLYSDKPFSRGQHGDVNRLLGNAGIAKLNSDGTLQLTALAIKAIAKLKPLAAGDSIPLDSFHEAGKRA